MRGRIGLLCLLGACVDLGEVVEIEIPPEPPPGPQPVVCAPEVMSADALGFCNELFLRDASGTGCQIPPGTETLPADLCDVSFQASVMPLITQPQSCANTLSCHGSGLAPQGFKVAADDPALTLANLLAPSTEFPPDSPALLNRVEPGSPEESYMIHKFLGTHLAVGGNGLQMPFLQPAFCPQQISVMCFWIASGAQDN
jgi:hypothetical protein